MWRFILKDSFFYINKLRYTLVKKFFILLITKHSFLCYNITRSCSIKYLPKIFMLFYDVNFIYKVEKCLTLFKYLSPLIWRLIF
jgi:hypothetical protein